MELIRPSESWIPEIEVFKSALEGSRYQGCSNLNKFKDIKEWLVFLKNQEEGHCLEGLVPNSVYMLVDNERLIGMVDIRHSLNDYLLNFGGNIGYTIHPDFRGKGYGKLILSLALLKCKEIGLSKVLVTCVDFNEKSKRIILANGGVLEDIRHEEEAGVNLMRFFIET